MNRPNIHDALIVLLLFLFVGFIGWVTEPPEPPIVPAQVPIRLPAVWNEVYPPNQGVPPWRLHDSEKWRWQI